MRAGKCIDMIIIYLEYGTGKENSEKIGVQTEVGRREDEIRQYYTINNRGQLSYFV